MIGQIGPSVRAGSRTTVVLHVLGGLLGGVCAGAVLGLFGIVLASLLGTPFRVLIVSMILLLAGAADLGFIPGRRLWLKRQTPLIWGCAFGTNGAAFAWGFDLATAITTRLPVVSLTGVVAFAFVSGSAIQSIAVLGLYGVVRAAAAMAVVTAARDHGAACSRLSKRAEPLSVAIGLLGVALAVVGIASAVV
jgi:hypothetical protein